MSFLYPLLNAINRLNLWLFLFLLITIILLIFILKFPINKQVKLEYLFLNFIALIIYLFLYIGLFMFLRLRLLGKELDLKLAATNIINIFIEVNALSYSSQVIAYLFMFILILLWLFFVFKFRLFLNYKIWQLFMFYYWRHPKILRYGPWMRMYADDQENPLESWLEHICRKINGKYSLHAFARKTDVFITIKTPLNFLFKSVKLVIRLIPLFVLLIMFVYECWVSNFVIYYTLFYLPVYMMVSLWMQVTEALYWWTDEVGAVGRLLAERAYHYPAVVYVNITEFDKVFIGEVLKNNRRVVEQVMDDWFHCRGDWDNDPTREGFISLPDKIIGWSRFERRVVKGIVIYYNHFRDQYFEENDPVEKDGYFFVKEAVEVNEEKVNKGEVKEESYEKNVSEDDDGEEEYKRWRQQFKKN